MYDKSVRTLMTWLWFISRYHTSQQAVISKDPVHKPYTTPIC